MEDKRIEILRDVDTGKAIMKLAFPAIIGFMVMAVYNIADTLFVSWWSYKGASAVQVVFPIMIVANAIGLMFGIGGGSYISRLIGENKYKRAESVVVSSLVSGIFIGILYAIGGCFFLEPIVKLFGASGDVILLSMAYGKYIIIGAIFVIPSMIFNNALRAEGSAKYSMYGIGIGSLINIFLDFIFIFVFDLGVEGAAMATLISQVISSIILLRFYITGKTMLKLNIKDFVLEWNMYMEILKIGFPTFLKQILVSISMGLFNTSAGVLGGIYLLSAVSISTKVTIIISFFIFGMGQGLQPLIGYNYGAQNHERVLSSQKAAFKKTFFGTAVMVIIYVVFARSIAGFFTSEPDVIEYSVIMTRMLSLSLLLTAISNTIVVIFQSIGNAKVSMFLSVLRQGLFFIPAIIVMSKLFGAKGLFASQLVADLLTVIASLIIYLIYLKKLKVE